MQALSVCTGDQIRHYVIFHDQVWENNRGNLRITSFFSSFHKIVKLDVSRSQNQGYALQPEGPRFDKLEEMIEHYHDFNLPKCDAKLTRPHRSWSVQTTWLEKIFKLTKKKEKKSLLVNRVLVWIASNDNSCLCSCLVQRKTEGAVQPSKYLLYSYNSLSYPGLS